jgi:bla regulator protein blaR1
MPRAGIGGHMGIHAAATRKETKKPLAIASALVLAATLIASSLRAQSPKGQSPAVQPPTPQWQIDAGGTSAGGKMAFEIASVKPSQSEGRSTTNIPLLGEAYAPTGGLLSITHQSLVNYLRFAFKDMKLAYQATADLAGAPAWVRSQPYDIEARAQSNPTKDQMRLMVQSLLADRFKLAIHYEKRQLPVYALVLAKEGKTGTQLKPDDGTCSTTTSDIQTINTSPKFPQPAASPTSSLQIPCGVLMPVPANAPGRFRVAGRKVRLEFLAQMASAPVTGLDRVILDRTGLSGTYDISLEFSPVAVGPPPPGFTPDETGLTFSQALQDQLGLKLEPQLGPVDVVVIDYVQQPSEN